MKKIIYLILIFALALPIFAAPQETHAATTQRYWNAYKKQLTDFLLNYKAGSTAADRSGCIRNTQMADGTTSSCLSKKKVDRIIAQLDRDNYWSLADPEDPKHTPGNPVGRRKYLLNTKEQPYVMKKVVMYFEQNLNLNTWIYGAQITAEQAYPYRELTFANLAAEARELAAAPFEILTGYWKGDSDIRALAYTPQNVGTTSEPVYYYVIKPKSTITSEALDKIYASLRMTTWGNWRSYSNWTQDEINAMAPVVAQENNPIDFARRHNVSPVYARMAVDAMETTSYVLVPEVGMMKWGGMNVAKGVAETESLGNISVGSKIISLTRDLIARIFQRSKLVSRPADRAATMIEIQGAANMVLGSGRQVQYLETRLSDLIRTSLRVGEAFPPGSGGGTGLEIFISDQAARSGRISVEAVEVMTHEKRIQAVLNLKLPVPTDELSKYPYFQHAWRQWDAYQTLVANGARVSRTQNVRFIDNVVSGLAKNQGISESAARGLMREIYNSQTIDYLGTKLLPSGTASQRLEALNRLENHFQSYEYFQVQPTYEWGSRFSIPWSDATYFDLDAKTGNFLR